MNSNPIGIFDSGVGGTTVWKEIHHLLPYESTVYLADSKNAPYGKKTTEEILGLSIKNTEKLIDLGAKIIVVACNTATTNAISSLRANYGIPFIGIEPAIKPAALESKTKKIGILATKGTINSWLFHQTSKNFAQGIQIIEVVDEGLVELIEADKIDSPETRKLLEKSLSSMLQSGVDHIVLGCTHFPYLYDEIKKIVPPDVKIYDSGNAVARRVEAVLSENNLLAPKQSATSVFYSNSSTNTLRNLLYAYRDEITIKNLDF